MCDCKSGNCGFDPHSAKLNINLKFIFPLLRFTLQRAALISAAQHAMPPESGEKWGMECLNSRFPLPTLLCAGYSVKLKKEYTYKAALTN